MEVIITIYMAIFIHFHSIALYSPPSNPRTHAPRIAFDTIPRFSPPPVAGRFPHGLPSIADWIRDRTRAVRAGVGFERFSAAARASRPPSLLAAS